MSRAGSEARLGRCPSPPSQDIRNRNVEVSRQHLSLIEAATPPAQRVQGDGNDGIGMVKQVTSRDAHQCGERTGQRPPSLVLECVNELAQRAAVVAGRPAKPPVAGTAQHNGAMLPGPSGRAVPHQPQIGGAISSIWRQQSPQTTPRVGSSSVLSHAAHRDAQTSPRTLSNVARSPARPGRCGAGVERGECARSRRRGELEPFGAAPESLEVVEATRLFGKHVDDAVKAVDEDPLGVLISFLVRRP